MTSRGLLADPAPATRNATTPTTTPLSPTRSCVAVPRNAIITSLPDPVPALPPLVQSLKEIKKKVNGGIYTHPTEFQQDVHLMLANAMIYVRITILPLTLEADAHRFQPRTRKAA